MTDTLQLGPFEPGPVPANASAVPQAFDPAAGGCEDTLQISDVLELGGSLPLLQVAGLGRPTEAP